MSRLDRLADHGVTVAAVAAVAVVGIETQADPTTVVTIIGGLGGYSLRRRRSERVGEGSGSE